jgi:hypothetical protein
MSWDDDFASEYARKQTTLVRVRLLSLRRYQVDLMVKRVQQFRDALLLIKTRQPERNIEECLGIQDSISPSSTGRGNSYSEDKARGSNNVTHIVNERLGFVDLESGKSMGDEGTVRGKRNDC